MSESQFTDEGLRATLTALNALHADHGVDQITTEAAQLCALISEFLEMREMMRIHGIAFEPGGETV